MNEAAQFIQDLAVIMMAAALAGLLCKRIRLSPIVGYLLAGIVIGPETPLAAWFNVHRGFISDPARVQLFAELGLVFLMFGIGLEFSLKRLRQLGVGVVFAAVIEGFLVFNLARIAGVALGLDRAGTVFFASTLVISSSAVIGKILTDAGRTHEKSSQLAFGVMLSEDIVVIILLTLLGSYVKFGADLDSHGAGTNPGSLLQTLALFGGFVILLATVGLLIIPRVLRRLSREATAELETIFVAGLLFGLSLMVVKAGYSLALGAFLLGAIIGETPQRGHVERAFAGMRAVFGMMFFVAIGMTIDVSTLPDAIGPLLLMTALALGGRALAAGGALVLLGYDARIAIRTALILTPIGEFSFVIARLGTDYHILPPEYMAAVVGASLLTSVISPLLIRRNDTIAAKLSARRIPLLSRAVELHHRALEVLQRQRESSLLLKLTRKRLIQIGVEVTLVSAVLFFAQPLIAWVVAALGPKILPDVPTAVVCWSGLGVLLLAPLIAIWRNIQALSMILADYLAHQASALARVRPLFTNVLHLGASLALVLWLWNFVPLGGGIWLTAGVLAFLLVVALLLWRRLIHWHSTMEVSLEASLTDEGRRPGHALIDRYAPWGLRIGEITLPDRFAFAGKSIGELALRTRFGCSLISVERQGFQLPNPGPGAHLFSDDRILVLGTDEQIAATRRYLLDEHPGPTDEDTFRDLAIDLVEIPAGSRAAGQTLATLNWPRLLGVQVVGHERGAERTVTPSGQLRVEAGDRLLVLGTPVQSAALRDWIG